MPDYNDIDLKQWKEYDHVEVSSLWNIPKRETGEGHTAEFHGNFIPQIPRQMMLRYTKAGDCIVDPFLGSGTTLVVANELKRKAIGIDINPSVISGLAQSWRPGIHAHQPGASIISKNMKFRNIFLGDSQTIDINAILTNQGLAKFQHLILHPPYLDIIKFSDQDGDLSGAGNILTFLVMFKCVVDNFTPFLETKRFISLVIGDIYKKGEWVPLGFQCMAEILKGPYTLKSIIVKNYEDTRAKRGQKNLWRYRSLAGGFYLFGHEYVFVFQKKEIK